MTTPVLRTDKTLAASIGFAIHAAIPGDNLPSSTTPGNVSVTRDGVEIPVVFACIQGSALVLITQPSPPSEKEPRGTDEIIVIIKNPTPSTPITIPVIYTEACGNSPFTYTPPEGQ